MTLDPAADPVVALTAAPPSGGGGRPGPLANAERPRTAVVVQALSAVVLGMALVFVSLGQQALSEVGGACASGGPYVSRAACPSGAGWLGAAIPLLIVATMLGLVTAAGSRTPLPAFPMWAGLFGTLGVGLLQEDGTGASVVGGVFLVMALPGLLLALAALRARPGDAPSARGIRARWLLAYVVLGGLGVGLGLLVHALV